MSQEEQVSEYPAGGRDNADQVNRRSLFDCVR